MLRDANSKPNHSLPRYSDEKIDQFRQQRLISGDRSNKNIDNECSDEEDLSDPDAYRDEDQSLSSEPQQPKPLIQSIESRSTPIVVPNVPSQNHHSRPTQGMKEPAINCYNRLYQQTRPQQMQDEDSQDIESDEYREKNNQRNDDDDVESYTSSQDEESNDLPSDSGYQQKA